MSRVTQSIVVDSTKPNKSWPLAVRKMPPDRSSSLCNQLDSALRIYRQLCNTTTSKIFQQTHIGNCIFLWFFYRSLVPAYLSFHTYLRD